MSVKSELATIEAKSNKTLDVIEVLAKEIHGQMKAIIDAIDMAKNNSKASSMAKMERLNRAFDLFYESTAANELQKRIVAYTAMGGVTSRIANAIYDEEMAAKDDNKFNQDKYRM